MNKRVILLLLAVLGIILISSTEFGCRKPEKKTYIVGIVNLTGGLEDVVTGFKKGMEELGYHEGDNITYLYDGPVDTIEAVEAKINEMLSKNVDLIYSLTTPATKKLKETLAGKNVPGVFGPSFDPVASEIVDSLARPGGQLTGVKVRGSTPKALEWLLAIAPDVKIIYVPFHVTDKAACQTLEDLEKTSERFNIKIITEKVTNNQELEKALAHIPKNADALWMTCSHLLFSNVEKIVKAAEARKLPTASSTHSPYRDGILVSYGENDLTLGKQVSRLADKMLKGTPPSALPVETAEYVLGVNLKTADLIGIKVPDQVIKQADHVVR